MNAAAGTVDAGEPHARIGRRTFLLGVGVAAAAWACSTPPARVEPLDLEPGARVRDIRVHAGTWWACGAVLAADGTHSPRLWTGPAPTSLHTVTTAPLTFYGNISELYSIGVGDLGLVAIGAQTGGFHAMPRSASWHLDGATLREVSADFELFGGPRSLLLAQATAGREFLIIGGRVDPRTDLTGGCAWATPTGTDVVLYTDAPGLRSEAGEQSIASAVTARLDGSYVAVGDGFATTGHDATTHARAWTTADPSTWQRAQVPPAAGGARSSMTAVAQGPDGLLAGGTVTADGNSSLCTWSSADGVDWDEQILTTQTTTVSNIVSEVTALVHDGDRWWLGARLGADPVLLVSTNGRDWFPRPLPVGHPSGAQVKVAVGSDGAHTLVSVTDLDHAVLATSAAG
jgi:hypothetical protein